MPTEGRIVCLQARPGILHFPRSPTNAGCLLLYSIITSVIRHKGSRYKLKIGSNHFFRLKMEQEQSVYCLLEGRYVFAVMPTGIACREVLE